MQTHDRNGGIVQLVGKVLFNEKNNYLDASQQANVDVPAGAYSDFTFFRVNADGTEEAISTIRLDGTVDVHGEDESWAAAFRDLSHKDDNGNELSYYVKETAVSTGNSTAYYTTFADTTSISGGAIANAVAYGTLNMTKTLELPADATENDYLAFLVISVVGPDGYPAGDSHYVNTTFTADDFTKTEIITEDGKLVTLTKSVELPAGIYTVGESGYNEPGMSGHWISAKSWIKADKTTDSSKADVEQTGAVETQVQVGMNTASDTNVAMNNNYRRISVQATKVREDGGLTGVTHPDISLTLSRKNGSSTEAITDGTHVIAGDELTTVWSELDYDSTYVLEEGPVNGYTASITGDQLTGFIVTNTRNTCDITVKKVVSDPSDTSEFSFSAFLSYGSEPVSGCTLYTDEEDDSGHLITGTDGRCRLS